MKTIFILSMIVCNACYGQIPTTQDTMDLLNNGWKHGQEYKRVPFDTTGTTTIGIITSKKHYDTIKVYATIINTNNVKFPVDSITNYSDKYVFWSNGKKVQPKPSQVILYSVKKLFKSTIITESDSEPTYYFQHIKYLGQDKKPLPKEYFVIKATELK